MAVCHTFGVQIFRYGSRFFKTESFLGRLFYVLGEVEYVFGIWAGVFLLLFGTFWGVSPVLVFLQGCSFKEPILVFLMMLVASMRPVIVGAYWVILWVSRRLFFLNPSLAFYGSCLVVGPLLGSLITEPAAMTVTALLLLDHVYRRKEASMGLKYATLGLLFVNISIGGVLTHFAAPPVVMVALKWKWDSAFMFIHFGWKAIVAILISTLLVGFWYRHELSRFSISSDEAGFVLASSIRWREALGVFIFLTGVVILGHMQSWWLTPVVSSISGGSLFWGATGLTAIMDNAMITFLGAQISTLDEVGRYILVSGAVVGGGLTVIANAPNPIGFGLLNRFFGLEGISAISLFLYALLPTIISAGCFCLL